MDALPIMINRYQLDLMQQEIKQAIAKLQAQEQAGKFAADSDRQREEILLTYGTNNYEEAYSLITEINDHFNSHLQTWQDEPETAKAIAVSLNTYQLGVLRNSLEHRLSQANAEPERQLVEDIIEQLPEHSPQENAD